MKVSEFLELLFPFGILEIKSCDEREIEKITVDSREVDSKSVFFCIKGEKFDGHDFIDSASENGAVLIVGEKNIKKDNYIQVRSSLKILLDISSVFYGNPQKDLKLIGITGTNGKTTVSYLIDNGFRDNFSTAVIGTLGYKIGENNFPGVNTTPFVWKWYELLAKIRSENVGIVISEVSSHGLDQKRIEGTEFDVGVFTNLSRDHLDYHKNLEDYYQAKKKLFTVHLKKEGRAVVNIDCPYGKRLYSELPEYLEKVSVSLQDKKADLFIVIKKESSVGTEAIFYYEKDEKEILINMIGRFNVYNAGCAVMAVEKFLDFEKAAEKVCGKIVVPGRMEMVGESSVFVDYAHTPDALFNILSSVKESVGNGKIIVVFGAGGDRDRGKRAEMGRVVCQLANIAIITDDNPRTENPKEIVGEILNGFIDGKCEKRVIHDRRKAIDYAVRTMKKEDVVIIAGKGAENYQIIGNEKFRFSDKEEVEKTFRELKNV
jgi:UDP-N-acetylmuramoyl-L-alanyl-D-glutamate--2,6-diaminopimelate ligase